MNPDPLSPLFSGPVSSVECSSAGQWWPRWRAITAAHRLPFERAVAGGADADRLAWAFASGYQAALRVLEPALPDDTIAALCVTEAEGNFPRAIRTTLIPDGNGFRISGEKRWTTLGPEGGLFIVIAREVVGNTGNTGNTGSDAARPSLKAVRVRSGAPGLTLETMPPTSFVPEVPHARLRLENVRVEAAEVLPGDGYSRYVKPFRTIEDIHIHAATIAYLACEARRRDWPQAWRERAAALLHALSGLALLDPLAPQTHVALAGALAIGAALIAETDDLWAASAGDPAAIRWTRDRALSGVADRARAQRLASAWTALSQAP